MEFSTSQSPSDAELARLPQSNSGFASDHTCYSSLSQNGKTTEEGRIPEPSVAEFHHRTDNGGSFGMTAPLENRIICEIIEREVVKMLCRGVRGATTVEGNTKEAILKATRQLLALMIRRNGIQPQDVGSAIFTLTKDLNAEFPALAARQMGWLEVPLLCGYEVDVPGSLKLCVRILVHWNTNKEQNEIHHVYIHDAVSLRPDLSKLPPVDWQELEHWIVEQMSAKKSS